MENKIQTMAHLVHKALERLSNILMFKMNS